MCGLFFFELFLDVLKTSGEIDLTTECYVTEEVDGRSECVVRRERRDGFFSDRYYFYKIANIRDDISL